MKAYRKHYKIFLYNVFLRHRQGSTLIEMMIAISIFAIFIAISVGGFAQSLMQQRLTLKLTTAVNNMGVPMEQMMREMRMGSNYSSPDGKSITFQRSATDDDGTGFCQTVTYALEGEKIVRTATTKLGGGEQQKVDFTLPGVAISSFQTAVTNVDFSSDGPYLATIKLGVKVIDKGTTIESYIQTAVESRVWGITCGS